MLSVDVKTYFSSSLFFNNLFIANKKQREAVGCKKKNKQTNEKPSICRMSYGNSIEWIGRNC